MLHLGRNLTISEKHIVAILGIQAGKQPLWVRSFTPVRVGDPPYKSMILVDDGRQCRLIYSPVSPSTLRGRIEYRHALDSDRKESSRS